MKLEDIINSLNLTLSYNTNKPINYVLVKTIIPNANFKSYKTYIYTLYDVNNNNEVCITLKEISNDKVSEFTKVMDKKFLDSLFRYILNTFKSNI